MKYAWFCFLLIFMVEAKANEITPCWFNNPVGNEITGFIGAANPMSSLPKGSLINSRKRALTALINYYEFDGDISELNFKDDEVKLDNGSVVLFSKPYETREALYSYAVIKTKNVNKKINSITAFCPVQQCEFSTCSPKWLCEEVSTPRVKEVGVKSIFGVSQITANPSQQLAKTKYNAQLLLKHILRSAVNDHTYRVKSVGKSQSWGFSEHTSSVDSLGANTKLLNTHSCQTSDFIFARYIYQSHQSVKLKPFEQWLKMPNEGETLGVVGSFSGLTADGLFSSAIKYAIKDGLIELAKAQKISIESDYQLKYLNGYYSLEISTMKTNHVVSGVLQDIRIIEKNGKLVIYVWLLEQEKI